MYVCMYNAATYKSFLNISNFKYTKINKHKKHTRAQ